MEQICCLQPTLVTTPHESHPKFVIPTEAHPDFLPRKHSPTSTCAAFVKESRMKFANATKFNRKSGVAKWRRSAVRPSS
jgi:hypothetical protein